MLNMIEGCEVPFPEKLSEGYEVREQEVVANLNAEKLLEAVRSFIAMHAGEPLFFILELPTNLKEEAEPQSVLHKDIYYLDGCSRKKALGLLEKYGELLARDGVSAFGFGCHETAAEIMVESYNIVTVWSRHPDKYRAFFEVLGVRETERLVTAWDTFSRDCHGTSRLVVRDGKDVYSLPEEMKEQGLYFAERREDAPRG